MKRLLVVVDVQNDFVDGTLGTKEAVAIIPNVVNKINNWDGDIVFTRDTHFSNYMETNEGKHLPVMHCICGTEGHAINQDVLDALPDGKQFMSFDKNQFGCIDLANMIWQFCYDYIEIIGLCTDICVISNALIIKARCPEATIAVDSSCCAGVTPESHDAAIATMKMCQIDVIGE